MPNATISNITCMPIMIPISSGKVRRKPKLAPEAVNNRLLGPGVMAATHRKPSIDRKKTRFHVYSGAPHPEKRIFAVSLLVLGIEANSALGIRQVLSQAILIARAASALPRCAASAIRHLQTLLPRLLRRRVTLRPHWQRLDLPDGDFVDLAWSEAPAQARHKPRLVVFHGLEGSLHSPYAHGLIEAAKARGWLGVVMHFRGCSGEPNRQKRIYHSGETEDGTWFLHWLREPSARCPPRR